MVAVSEKDKVRVAETCNSTCSYNTADRAAPQEFQRMSQRSFLMQKCPDVADHSAVMNPAHGPGGESRLTLLWVGLG